MPYVSRSQQGYMHSAAERGEIDPDVVDKFDQESRGQHDLPYHVKKKKRLKKSVVLVPIDLAKGGLVRDLHGRMVPPDSIVPMAKRGELTKGETEEIIPEDDTHDAQGGLHPPPANPVPIPMGKRPRRRVRNPQGGNPRVMVTMDRDTMGKALPGKKPSGHKTAPKGYPSERTEYADPKNFKYPLSSEEKIRAANSYLSQADNQSEYSPEEVKAMFARIHRAGKKHGIKFEGVMDKDLSVTAAGPSL